MRRPASLWKLFVTFVCVTAICEGVRAIKYDSPRTPSAQTSRVSTTPRLPSPTGPYSLGTSVVHLTDSSRRDKLSKKPAQFRELMIQIWYPRESAVKGKAASYIPDRRLIEALKEEQHDAQEPKVFDAWTGVGTSALLAAGLPRKPARFPLLFFSHGLGEPRSLYTAFAQDLASHGYIVVCVDHPYGGITVLPDGTVISTAGDPDAGNPEATPKQVEAWARDASVVLDRLTNQSDPDLGAGYANRIDGTRIGMLGHSLGGVAALEACRSDSRFKACADLDGAPFGKIIEAGVKRPTLLMRSGPIYSDEELARKGRTRAQWDEMGRKGQAMWDTVFERSKDIPFYIVKVHGAGHMSFSDAPFVMPDVINRFGGRIINANRGFEIMSHYIRDFFGKYLSGKESILLDGKRNFYQEVSAERRL